MDIYACGTVGDAGQQGGVPSWRLWMLVSPTLKCVLQLRISCSQWVVFNGVKGQTSVIVQSDPSISIKGSLLLGER